MGSEQVLKKTVLGGFKKEGVLNYVEQLQSEIIELKKEISNTPDYSEDVEALKLKNEESAANIARISAKYDAVKAENEALTDKNKDLINELENAYKLIAEYEEKQKIFEEKIVDIEEKFNQITSGYCVKSESTSIVSEANKAVLSAKNDITDINERIKTVCNNFESSSNSLKSCIENLLGILTDVSTDLSCENDKGE